MRLMKKGTLTLFLLLAISIPLSAQYVVQGVVTDSLTKEPLPYASVRLKDTTEGTTTGSDGRFYFKTHRSEAVLVISVIGYNDYVRTIRPARNASYKVALAPTEYALGEVVVKPKREHYRKKDNPAVEFVRRMIESRDNYSPYEKDFWQRERYEKTTFALNNFDEEKQKKWLYRKFDFLTEYVDTSAVTGKPILTVSARELLATDYYRKSPRSEKQWVKGRKQAGVDEFLSKQGMQAAINEVFKDVDIYENNISLFTNKFVSPLSRIGTGFYKYYLMDTLQIAGEPCADLAFTPFNSESFGFNGHLYVTLDSTYFVKRAVFNFPKKINLNFVDYMLLEQEFKRAEDGTRLLDHESITVEFKLTEGQDGIFARRVADYSNYTFTPTAEADKAFTKPERIIEETEALSRPETFWAENRPQAAISQQENSVDRLMTQLRSYPVYYWTEKVLSILFTGYIPTSKEAPLFYIGPMNATISGNTLEGPRIRAGGMTTAWLNPHLFGKGYVAYGFKDERVKGLAELEYSFKKKKEYANEFPIHSLKLRYESDVNQYGQNYLYTSKDNVFLALKRMSDTKTSYLQNTELSYQREHDFGFSYGANLRYKIEESTRWVPFIENSGKVHKYYNWAETEVHLRYAPNEKFYQTKGMRYPINRDAPIFFLSHTFSPKDFLGSSYMINRTDFRFSKDFWFSAFGHLETEFQFSHVWNQAPFTMLILPNANLSYTIQEGSYSLLSPMEFVLDSYASWDITYFANGILFNRIPGIKMLRMREVLSFKGFFGNLSNPNLWRFPGENAVYVMNPRRPYMEFGAGLDNIFKILRIEYVWRLTYREHTDVAKGGVRIALHFSF